MTDPDAWRLGPVAVLLSGGPDSAVLLGELARSSPRVVPVYVRFGTVWDDPEEAAVRRFAAALPVAVDPVRVFDLPIRAVYGEHWSTTGRDVPDAHSPDSAVFLPGRNLLIPLPAAVWCHLNGIPTLAMGLLRGNPFPDSTDAFFAAYEQAVNLALGADLRFVRPYAALSKAEVLQRGRSLPLGLTWSCMMPVRGQQCGRCNKCAERQQAFAAAGIPDPTDYAAP